MDTRVHRLPCHDWNRREAHSYRRWIGTSTRFGIRVQLRLAGWSCDILVRRKLRLHKPFPS